MKGERSGMATPRNPVPRAAIAEIDEALMAAAWWEHALIDLQNGRREAEKTNYSRRFEKRTATGFKSRPPNFVKLAVQT